MPKKLSRIAIYFLSLILIACANQRATSAPDLNGDAIRTQAVETFASALTETLVALPVASPTLTSLPSFTPAPVTETSAPEITANPCYKLLYLKDLTFPDGAHLKNNEVFTKTWEVQNNGGCAWAPGFALKHVGGESLRGEPLILTEPIPVGLKYKLSIELVAPSGQNGLVQSSWRMADANGVFFGDTLTINIIVGNSVTATP
ncbi:MAG: hypothetical protein IT310_06175 [Anaerolineales bacterium]|nr:hypothetical protein [Anaerolineales bacterium]